ncbi:M24 family metallopeptidase [Desulforudis sp. 1088]|jgi:Xaa-Pro aminopeptidase|uniref:M24 family metallopeptidase n=1 Tax=unclassified Candidatus Desulforudis TaxID=2635950 RepID=UPI00348C8D54
MHERVEALRRAMETEGLPYLLVTGSHNRRYLSGFTGTTGVLLIGMREAYLLTDFRYLEQVRVECPDFNVLRVERSWVERLAQALDELDVRVLGFEGEHLTYQQYSALKETAGQTELRPTRGMVESLREIKDEEEIAVVRKAVSLVDDVFELLTALAPGRQEREVAVEIAYRMRLAGASGTSFEIIVASGERSAMPHGVASEKVMREGELVVVDCGCVYQGYCSDFTRTVLLGREPEPWQTEIYDIVLKAQLAAINAIRPGATCAEVDAAARDIISGYGYGEYFGHSTGHGLGLEIHESPRLSANEQRTLAAGNVVTVEPGIYLPGRGGVRIEDVVVVREHGAEVLTRTPKQNLVLL